MKRKKQDVDADIEALATDIWNKGVPVLDWSALIDMPYLLPEHARKMAFAQQQHYMVKIMQRMKHFCHKCKVICNTKLHVCQYCLTQVVHCYNPNYGKCRCDEMCDFNLLPARQVFFDGLPAEHQLVPPRAAELTLPAKIL